MHKPLVKITNNGKLRGWTNTLWRVQLGLRPDVKPSWRTLYKPKSLKGLETYVAKS